METTVHATNRDLIVISVEKICSQLGIDYSRATTITFSECLRNQDQAMQFIEQSFIPAKNN